eukprot:UN02495
MDASEFQVFVSDIRIKDKRISSKSLRGPFVLANMEPEEMQEANSRPVTREAEPVGGDDDEEELFNPGRRTRSKRVCRAPSHELHWTNIQASSRQLRYKS